MEGPRFESLHDLNTEAPDHDHWSTVDNLAVLYSASEHLQCWRKEDVEVADIDLLLLLDDPDALDSEAKIEGIRATMKRGQSLPAIVLIHGAGTPPHAYRCMEGMHRFNAVYREGVATVFAWVAHIGCCGGPIADLADVEAAA